MEIPQNHILQFVRQNHFAKWQEKPKHKAYFTLTAFLLFVAFFGFFAINPAVNIVLSTAKTTDDLKDKLAQTEQRINLLGQLGPQFEDAQQERQILNEALPLAAEPIAFAKELEIVAGNHGVDLTAFQMSNLSLSTVSITAGAGKFSVQEAAFVLNLSGDFSNMRQVVSEVEKLKRLVQIKEVSFDLRTTGELTATINGKVFFVSDKNAPAKSANNTKP